jgi:three-Cys-motif partner protein
LQVPERVRHARTNLAPLERSRGRCAELEALKVEFPQQANDISIRQGDANTEIRALCDLKTNDWRFHRAVLFLDPYGMQVEWETIEAIAATKAIDMWLLFPLGMGVSRLLTRSGDIPEPWQHRLDVLLGTTSWREEFYRVHTTSTLFGPAEQVERATIESIGRYFTDRLKTVFAAVAEQPRILRNSANSPLYLFCFAAGNERGAPVALRIANHLLTKGVQ